MGRTVGVFRFYQAVLVALIITGLSGIKVAADYSPLAYELDGEGNALRPDYRLVNLRPEGFAPSVSDLAWMPDGKLVVVEWSKNGKKLVEERQFNGTIYLVDGVGDAQSPNDVTYSIFKDSLEIPTGVVVLGDTVYVSSGYTIDGHIDSDKDGVADKTHKVFDFDYEEKCRHEFMFGLTYIEPNFMATASRCKSMAGNAYLPDGVNIHTWQMHKGRGAAYLINRFTGQETLIAGGFREPYGMSKGPDGDVFSSDNQGNWLPSSKIVHIQPKRFYGFRADNFTLEEEYGPDFKDLEESPSAIWLPHRQISHSPTHPFLVKEGPFKGQLLVGDVGYGGIQRCYIEKVNGEWQGAVFNWTGGFEAGVGTIIDGKDGELIVGGLGNGVQNAWGWLGQRSGLQKIIPIPGAPTVFEPLKVRSRRNGMEIEFTKPVNETAAMVKSNYDVRRYEMQTQLGYGKGNLAERTAVEISNIVLSDDKTKVFLEIDIPAEIYREGKLQPNTGVSIEMTPEIKSAAGDELWVSRAFYSLNQVSDSEALSVDVKSNIPKDIQFSTTPNPSGLRVNVDVEGNYSLTLSSLNGKLIGEWKGNGRGQYQLAKDLISTGIHFLSLNVKGKIYNKRVVLK